MNNLSSSEKITQTIWSACEAGHAEIVKYICENKRAQVNVADKVSISISFLCIALSPFRIMNSKSVILIQIIICDTVV